MRVFRSDAIQTPAFLKETPAATLSDILLRPSFLHFLHNTKFGAPDPDLQIALRKLGIETRFLIGASLAKKLHPAT